MQRAHRRIRDIIEYGSCKDALIASEIDRLQECRTIDIVGRAPRAVYPVSTSLQDIMLEIVLVFQQYSDGFGLFSKLLKSPEVPFVQCCQVILRHTIPSQFLASTGKRLLVERSPRIAILTADAFVVVTSAIRPKAIVLAEQEYVMTLHLCDHRVDTVCATKSFLSGHETRQRILGLSHCHIGSPSVPPGRLVLTTDQHRPVFGEPCVGDGVASISSRTSMTRITRDTRDTREPRTTSSLDIPFKPGRINPHLQGDTWLQGFLR